MKYDNLYPRQVASFSPSDVHIWYFSLNHFYWCIEKLKGNLSPEEKERADFFLFDQDRSHYQMFHGLLREILGLYLNLPPLSLKFCFTTYGKPYIDPSVNSTGIRFNCSYSNGIALVGIALQREIGVDVEAIHKINYVENLVKIQFTDYEKKKFYSLSDDKKLPFFYSCWVRKEALLKAIGAGIGNDLSHFNVVLNNKAEIIIDIPNSEGRKQTWLLKDLKLSDNVKCAFCIEGENHLLHLIQPQNNTLHS